MPNAQFLQAPAVGTDSGYPEYGWMHLDCIAKFSLQAKDPKAWHTSNLQNTVLYVLPHIKTNHAPEKIILFAKYKKHLDG